MRFSTSTDARPTVACSLCPPVQGSSGMALSGAITPEPVPRTDALGLTLSPQGAGQNHGVIETAPGHTGGTQHRPHLAFQAGILRGLPAARGASPEPRPRREAGHPEGPPETAPDMQKGRTPKPMVCGLSAQLELSSLVLPPHNRQLGPQHQSPQLPPVFGLRYHMAAQTFGPHHWSPSFCCAPVCTLPAAVIARPTVECGRPTS